VINKFLLSLLRRFLTWRYPHLLLSAGAPAARRRSALAAIDRCLLPTGRSAAEPPAAVAVIDRWDRQTDGRTDSRPLHRPWSACCAGSVNSWRRLHSVNIGSATKKDRVTVYRMTGEVLILYFKRRNSWSDTEGRLSMSTIALSYASLPIKFACSLCCPIPKCCCCWWSDAVLLRHCK